MDRTEAYMQLLDAIQKYVEIAQGSNLYARDWILITGIEAIQGDRDEAEVRVDSSPNTANWTTYGLLTLALDNFHTGTDY